VLGLSAVRAVRVVPAVGAVVVLAVAAIGYDRFIPIHHVQRPRLAHLVVTNPGPPFAAKPASSNEVPASSNPFAAYKTAAKRAPNSTGAYSVGWTGSASSSDVASVVVSLLPSKSDATSVEAQAPTTYLGATSFKSNSYALVGPLAVPAVTGAQGATFRPTSAKGTPRLVVVVFQMGRYVVVDFVQRTGATAAQASATSLAQAEAQHLRQVGSGFSLVVTTWPTDASLIYGGVAVAIALITVVVPVGVSRGRRRRRLAREAVARRAVQGRGRKIAKHQAVRRR
jgi:hypothetical protein